MSDFIQEFPSSPNTYLSHRWMAAYLRYKLPSSMRAVVDQDLTQLGERCAGPYLELARTAEREKPQLISFDPWGRRIDEIRVSSAWVEHQNISAREGLVHIGYKREYGEFSRVYQFAKLYLYHPSSAFFTCPLAMADGAAKVLETYGTDAVHKEALAHLISDDPTQFWTSGQWMTERTGGSDVGRTSTIAESVGSGARLFGTKWFSSATTSSMALALARFEGAPEGSKGLSLFYVPMRLENGALNHLKVLRLKDKLGTWALPTAELQLEGTKAHLIGAKEQGVKTVSTMLNVTRLYNSICSVGQMTRALESMRLYSAQREVFGVKLENQVLHFATFAQEEVKLLAGFLLTMELVHLLGKEECGTSSSNDQELLRLMTPICKLFTARSAVQTASEVVEGFGGAGYIEDTGIPVHLRDSQVFPIWEGATNVLSLDMIRVLQKTNALSALKEETHLRLKGILNAELLPFRDQLQAKFQSLELRLNSWAKATVEDQMASSKDLAFHLAWLYSNVLALVWVDQEAPENRRQMMAWITQLLKSCVDWKPKDSEEVARVRQIWQTSLTV